jgi:hypothetical protein
LGIVYILLLYECGGIAKGGGRLGKECSGLKVGKMAGERRRCELLPSLLLSCGYGVE